MDSRIESLYCQIELLTAKLQFKSNRDLVLPITVNNDHSSIWLSLSDNCPTVVTTAALNVVIYKCLMWHLFLLFLYVSCRNCRLVVLRATGYRHPNVGLFWCIMIHILQVDSMRGILLMLHHVLECCSVRQWYCHWHLCRLSLSVIFLHCLPSCCLLILSSDILNYLYGTFECY